MSDRQILPLTFFNATGVIEWTKSLMENTLS